MKGMVKWFSQAKRYGFVCNIEDMEDDYFLHSSEIIDNAILSHGDEVEFEPITTDRGKAATKVKKL